MWRSGQIPTKGCKNYTNFVFVIYMYIRHSDLLQYVHIIVSFTWEIERKSGGSITTNTFAEYCRYKCTLPLSHAVLLRFNIFQHAALGRKLATPYMVTINNISQMHLSFSRHMPVFWPKYI